MKEAFGLTALRYTLNTPYRTMGRTTSAYCSATHARARERAQRRRAKVAALSLSVPRPLASGQGGQGGLARTDACAWMHAHPACFTQAGRTGEQPHGCMQRPVGARSRLAIQAPR